MIVSDVVEWRDKTFSTQVIKKNLCKQFIAAINFRSQHVPYNFPFGGFFGLPANNFNCPLHTQKFHLLESIILKIIQHIHTTI